jgi:hypothetical protein
MRSYRAGVARATTLAHPIVIVCALAGGSRVASAQAAPEPPVAAAPAAPSAAVDPHPDWATLPEEAREELECLERVAHPTPAIVEEWHRTVPPSFIVRGRVVAGGFMGGDGRGPAAKIPGASNVGLDYGYDLAAAGTLALLHPLQLDGAVRYMGGGSSSQLQADVTAGFAFREYGDRWVPAGATAGGGVVHSWSSHCQTRRNDFVLQAGLKLFRETLTQPEVSRSIPALQLGLASHHLAGSAVDSAFAVLWAPGQKACGAQVSFGASRLLIAIPIPVDWLYTGMNLGALVGSGARLWWMTVDLGVAFEL